MLLLEMTYFPHAACVVDPGVCSVVEKSEEDSPQSMLYRQTCALTPPTTAVQRAASEGTETSDPIMMSLARLGLVPTSLPCYQEHGYDAHACFNCKPPSSPTCSKRGSLTVRCTWRPRPWGTEGSI